MRLLCILFSNTSAKENIQLSEEYSDTRTNFNKLDMRTVLLVLPRGVPNYSRRGGGNRGRITENANTQLLTIFNLGTENVGNLQSKIKRL